MSHVRQDTMKQGSYLIAYLCPNFPKHLSATNSNNQHERMNALSKGKLIDYLD